MILPLPAAPRAEPPLLGVERSMRGLKWVERLAPSQAFLGIAIAQRHGLPELVGRLLAARGVGLEEVPNVLNPTLRALCPDPSAFAGMAEAAERLVRAILAGERIAIFGDYDVDGAASSALLYRFLAFHGIDATIYIPDRIAEGYGPNGAAFASLADAGHSLIVTVDCGSTSFDALELAAARGVDTVVIDHHQVGEALPAAWAVVNPNRQDCLSGQGHLCAAGVVFMVCVAVTRALRARGVYRQKKEPDLMSWLDLVGLATVCDVVPLQGVNRAFVVQGLKMLGRGTNLGLRALCGAAALKTPPTPYTLGFVLGPRINAGGRIGDAAHGARLLTCEDAGEALRMASTLDDLNRERRDIEMRTVEEASAWADRALLDDPACPIVIAGSPSWHKGLVGLVASRLTERHRRPCLIFAQDEASGEATGSARSIAGVDIGAAVRGAVAAGVAKKGGGHAMAAGVTAGPGQMPGLIAYLTDAVSASYRAASASPTLALDGAIYPRAITAELAAQLESAGPFGQGNPAPRFCLPSVRLSGLREIGTGHLKCTLKAQDGSQIDGVAFRAAQSAVGEALSASRDAAWHVAGRIERNEWGGRDRLEFQIEDVSPVKR